MKTSSQAPLIVIFISQRYFLEHIKVTGENKIMTKKTNNSCIYQYMYIINLDQVKNSHPDVVLLLDVYVKNFVIKRIELHLTEPIPS